MGRRQSEEEAAIIMGNAEIRLGPSPRGRNEAEHKNDDMPCNVYLIVYKVYKKKYFPFLFFLLPALMKFDFFAFRSKRKKVPKNDSRDEKLSPNRIAFL